jgi:hypothetical protein
MDVLVEPETWSNLTIENSMNLKNKPTYWTTKRKHEKNVEPLNWKRTMVIHHFIEVWFEED